MTLPTALLWLATGPAFAGPVVVLGEKTLETSGAAGSEVRGEIRLRNTSTEPSALRLIPTGYVTDAASGHRTVEIEDQPRSSATWLQLPGEVVVVPAESDYALPYTVRLPEDPTLAGSYWTALVLEDVEATESPSNIEGLTLRQRARIVMRLVTHVGDTGARAVLFGETTLRRDGAVVVLQADVENTGERLLNVTPRVELYDDAGHKVGAWAALTGPVMPGSAWRFPVPLTDAPPGEYTAVILADAGFDAMFGARHPVRID